jgi:hypothetical protein
MGELLRRKQFNWRFRPSPAVRDGLQFDTGPGLGSRMYV